jgi:hypothetical protein
MNTNRTIRIIKGTERGNQAVVEQSAASKGEDARPTTTREAAGNVSSWVKEFRQRRRPDPRRAFASLFAEQAAPLNSLS